ncbi:MAG: 4-alpha-glucanotransferase [Piscinibacter sp.]|uniref:4-alpha-glucanotransferase n=1 Tax=Piscinibacter sp. TaxID=1903157 RepID=UPI003D0E7252
MRFPRRSGILLHPTSLPGPHGSGDLGDEAHAFVDWLAGAGQSLWQVLPLGGLGPGNSPYMSSSAFAGNVLMIDLRELQRRGWLSEAEIAPVEGLDPRRVNFAAMVSFRMQRLALAAARFAQRASAEERADLAAFEREHTDWLPDYALFMALAEHHGWRDWCEWPDGLAQRTPPALQRAREAHRERIAFWTFCQWRFFRQWAALRAHAHSRGVHIVGDMPIFVAYQSADVWARPELFELDAAGRPTVIAGVPPDAFSATGQRWGNPLYRWSAHAQGGYAWWIERVRRSVELVEIVRIDHFRGFAAHWEIPANEPTAVKGHWEPGPGEALFRAIADTLGPLPIIAEDLGVITPDVDALRHAFDFPGMRILQFAWGEGIAAERRFQPHRHEADTVVYTGTHDNDTSVGWWASADEATRHHLREYLATDGRAIHWDMIRMACASVADTAIYPLQDVMGLGGEGRMNFPGQGEGWWAWRFDWNQVPQDAPARLRRMAELYERLPPQTG